MKRLFINDIKQKLRKGITLGTSLTKHCNTSIKLGSSVTNFGFCSAKFNFICKNLF